jgi:hypothetical protein
MDAHNVGHDRGKVAVADVFIGFLLLRSRLHIKIVLPFSIQHGIFWVARTGLYVNMYGLYVNWSEPRTANESISIRFLF